MSAPALSKALIAARCCSGFAFRWQQTADRSLRGIARRLRKGSVAHRILPLLKSKIPAICILKSCDPGAPAGRSLREFAFAALNLCHTVFQGPYGEISCFDKYTTWPGLILLLKPSHALHKNNVQMNMYRLYGPA